MGLFSKKEAIGEVTFFMYPNRELVIQNTFSHPDQWDMTIMAFALFLAKIVSDLGQQRGTALWKSLFHHASVARDIVSKKDGLPLEGKMINATPPLSSCTILPSYRELLKRNRQNRSEKRYVLLRDVFYTNVLP